MKGMLLSAAVTTLAFAVIADNATITVDCAKPMGKITRTERSWTTIKVVKGAKDRELLKALKPAYIRMFNLGHTGDEDGEAKELGASPVICYTPGDCANHNGSSYESGFRTFLKNAKQLHPNLEFVEIQNEPDWHCKLKPQYFDMLARAAKVGAEINATLPVGQPKIKIGGPVITGLDNPQESWIPDMLDYVKANKVDLGFVAYHQYVPNPKRHYDNISKVALWLSQRSMPMLPQLNTEWNFDWQNPSTSKVDANTLAYVAAYIMASHYYYALGEHRFKARMIPMAFACNDYVNPHRSLVIASQTDGTDGTITPHYNVRKMQSMMKDNWVDAQGIQMDANGYGLGAMASTDSKGITVLIWNCFHQCTQYTGGKCSQTSTAHMKSYTVKLDFANLPAVSGGNTTKYELYQVDSKYSNYAASKAGQHLTLADEGTLTWGSSMSKILTLAPNTVMLVSLVPQGTLAATAASRIVNRTGARTMRARVSLRNERKSPRIVYFPPGTDAAVDIRGRGLFRIDR